MLVPVLVPACHPKQTVLSSPTATTSRRLRGLPSELEMVANVRLLKMCQETFNHGRG